MLYCKVSTPSIMFICTVWKASIFVALQLRSNINQLSTVRSIWLQFLGQLGSLTNHYGAGPTSHFDTSMINTIYLLILLFYTLLVTQCVCLYGYTLSLSHHSSFLYQSHQTFSFTVWWVYGTSKHAPSNSFSFRLPLSLILLCLSPLSFSYTSLVCLLSLFLNPAPDPWSCPYSSKILIHMEAKSWHLPLTYRP